MAASAPEDVGPAKDVTRPGLEAAFIAMQQERQLRREQLATPEARAERRRSRTQFRNASHAEALSLGARFADSLRADVWKSVPLRNGEKIERFVGDFGARVSRPEGGPVALVESTVPLQAPEEDGGKAPVELALEDRGGHFEPSHPLVPIRVPKDPEEPVRFEGSGVGMRLSAVRPDAEGVEVADRLAVTDALEDTDLYVTPVARGFETSAVLRSANSPERLELELDLPPGAELVPLEGGAAEVVRDGRSVTTITAPVAWDADKQPVPVDASVEGNRFVIYVPHRERDVHYPLLVDPEFQDHWNWKDFWNQGEDGWVRATNAPGVFDSAYANFPHRWGAGLYIWTQPVWTCCWSYSEWRRYPHGRDTHFPRADVQVSANGAAWTCAYSGIWAARYGRWDSGPFWMCPVDTHHVTMCVVSDCNWDHGAEGSYVAQALSADGGIQRHDSDKGMSSLRRAWTWMWDRQPPEFSGVNRGGTTPWARERSGTVSGPARDFGLGMKYTVLTAPGTSWGNSAGDGRTRDAGCSGMWNSRCPESLGTDWTFSTTEPGLAGVEGRIAIDVRASDIIGRWSSVRWGYMSIDRSAPVITLSGPLKDRENQELPPGTYELRIDARDGDPNGLNAAKRSGVRSVEVTLDGEVVDYRDQTCSDHSCPLGRSWTFDTSAHPGGEHVVVVTAIDQLGHETSKELRFSTGCCARPATSWGTSPVGATGAFGDVNGDGTDDSVVRQNATGTVYVGLSDGTRFSDWQPWGQGPSPPAPWRFEVADVTGDGLEDIWTRNSVTDEVVVMPSDGLSFRPAQSWGSWAYSDTTLADVDGDAIIDIVGRDPANQQVLVGRSTGSSYEPAEVYGSLGAASRVYAGDVDGDGTADLIGHDTQSGQLSVGLSDVSSFEPGTAWGSLDPQLEVRIEDVNGDGAADVVGRSSETGDVRVATSAEDGFRAARGWTNVPATHSFYVTDGTGDGQADATGRNELTGEVLVSVSDAVVPSEPLAEIWEEPTDVLYDTGDDLMLRRAAPSSSSMLLAFEDEAELKPIGAAAEDSARRTIARFAEAGGDVVRFQVFWGAHENWDPNPDNPNKTYYWQGLDQGVQLARDRGLRVFLTLTGVNRHWECVPEYNPNGRECVTGVPTGRVPSASQFATFARAAATHFGSRVDHYSIWNEPNHQGWLQGSSGADVVPSSRYRDLFEMGSQAIRQADPGARVFIGELASAARAGGGRFPGEARKHPVSAADFLRETLRPPSSSSPPLTVDGVAWHPYQHRLPPRRRRKRPGALPRHQCGQGTQRRSTDSGCGRGELGIGELARIQSLLNNLWKETAVAGHRWLRTASGRRPGLYLTEFGYFNRPRNRADVGVAKGNRRNYWHSERTRGRWLWSALDHARRNKARWMLIYHGVERPPPTPPGQYRNDWDSGLFEKPDGIGGTRPYGKSRSNAHINNPQPRQAYCRIWERARTWRYAVIDNGCPGILAQAPR